MSLDALSRTTALVVAQDARRLRKLLVSRQRHFPELRALVAAYEPEDRTGVEWVRFGSDVSANARRNALLARVKTPYVLLFDDGDRLRRGSNPGRLVEPLAKDQFDLVAGGLALCRRRWGLFTARRRWDEFGTFAGADGPLEQARLTVAGGADVERCDYASPWFAARTDKLRAIGGWDESLAPSEHLELYVRAARYDLRVGHCGAAVVDRWTKQPPSQPAPQALELARAA